MLLKSGLVRLSGDGSLIDLFIQPANRYVTAQLNDSELYIEDGAEIKAQNTISVGHFANEVSFIYVNGGKINNSGLLQLGRLGSGTLTVRDNAAGDKSTITTGILTAGNTTGGNGKIYFYDNTVVVTDQLFAGQGTTGTIEAYNDVDISALNVSVLSNNNNSSYIKLSDNSSLYSEQYIDIGGSYRGSPGFGTLIVKDNASLTTPLINLSSLNSRIYIGGDDLSAPGSVGRFDVALLTEGLGTVFFNHTRNDFVFSGVIEDAIKVQHTGTGKTVLTGNNTYSGGTTITNGVLQVGDGGIRGALVGNINIAAPGKLSVNRSDDLTTANVISGAGTVEQIGTDILTLTGDSSAFAGDVHVRSGGINVNGKLGGSLLTVYSGGSIAGVGEVTTTTVQSGGTLIGHQGSQLSFTGDLTLANDSNINIDLGAPSNNGLFDVAGNLTLDGRLNIVDAGGFAVGVYRIFDYTGSMFDNVLEFGSLPSGIAPTDLTVQTVVPNQVNLINANGVALNYWDGSNFVANGLVDGGNGTWNANASNWTKDDGSLNARWNGSFAIFQGAPGTVEVDDSLGAISANGMQFVVDGYRIQGASITLKDAESIIRVGAGANAQADNVTATIASELTGNAALVKTDLGTLVLTADNSYLGGTTIRAGTLQVSKDANLGDAAGDVRISKGVLRNSAEFTTERAIIIGIGGATLDTQANLNVAGVISGAESLTKTGAATLVLTGNNTYGEGTTIRAGAVQLGNGGTTGWIEGDVVTDGRLIFNRSDDVSFAGNISGSGGIVQAGPGSTTLSATNDTLFGLSEVQAGSLFINTVLGGSMRVSAGQLRGVGVVGDTTLEAGGIIAPGLADAGSVGTLTIQGDFVGNGGRLSMEAALGDDNSPSDLLRIVGDATGAAGIQVINVGGGGAPTVEGIKLVDILGASDANFALIGDYVFEGDQAVVGGAYAYRLYKGGVSTPNDGDWYLRSGLIDDDPVTPPETPPVTPEEKPPEGNTPTLPPHYQAGVPAYEAYPQALLGLNGLNTLQQRVGNRTWEQGADGSGQYGLAGTQRNGAWVRIEGGRSTLNPQYSDVDGKYRQNSAFVQTGYDRLLDSNDDGAIVVGANLNTAYGKTRIRSRHGDGHIKTEGYGVGANATWYGTNGLYLDGQAQAMWYRSDLSSKLVAEKLVSRNRGSGYAFSAELGRSFSMADNWTWTPQAQLRYSSVDFKAFEDVFDTPVKMGRGDEFTGRVGLGISRENSWRAQSGSLSRAHIYGIANINYDFDSASRVEVYDTRIEARIPRLGADVGLGGTYSWGSEKYAVYGEATIGTLTDDFGHSNDVKAQMGFKMSW